MDMTDVARVTWVAHEDTIRALLPVLELDALREVGHDLRVDPVHLTGRWSGLPADVEARRVLLLDEVARRGSELNGGAWGWLDDLVPELPADVSPADFGA